MELYLGKTTSVKFFLGAKSVLFFSVERVESFLNLTKLNAWNWNNSAIILQLRKNGSSVETNDSCRLFFKKKKKY